MPITTTPSGGPQGEFSTYTPIYAQTLSSAAASITFSNIPTTFTDLRLVYQTGMSSAGNEPYLRFNSDSSSLYSETVLYGNGTSALSFRNNISTAIQMARDVGLPTAIESVTTVDIMNYSNTTTFKNALIRTNKGSASYSQVGAYISLYRSTSPITSINLSTSAGNFVTGSTFTLYGIKAAVSAPKASGGNTIVSDGNYWYHTFTTTGVFTPSTSLTCDYLVVGGGGSGGYGRGGGGGAGGYRSATSVTISTATTATIGAGGTNTSSSATNGVDSSFSSTTSAGGGFGGGLTPGYNGASGGSGGGGIGIETGANTRYGDGNTPSTSPSQGFRGGGGHYNEALHGRLGGGGGGAGAVGADASSSTPGNGGVGSNTFASWAIVTGTGYDGYYAGGGGGGRSNTTAGVGVGGLGGAGHGGNESGNSATRGLPNTGSGGGGGGGIGGFGGSGIVIVRYPANA
jgi:hypothetical protein